MGDHQGIIITIALCALVYMMGDALLMELRLRPAKKKFWVHFTPDDPLMLEASEKARASLATFETLRDKYPRFASLALGPIREDGGMTPALVRGKTAEGDYLVRRARNEDTGNAIEEGPEFVCKRADIVDWIVYESEKKEVIHGGFTLRAVVAIARRDGATLPSHVLYQEKKFVDG